MSTTIARAFAERLREQTSAGLKVLQRAGYGGAQDRTGEVFGDPAQVLSVRGNVSDIAWTNHLWLLDAVASEAIAAIPPELQRPRPGSIEDAVRFLDPRDTDTAAQAIAHLERVNNAIAGAVEQMSDADLERPVEMQFYGRRTLRDFLFLLLDHGSLHLGQAWGILKGKGLA
jgi:hypothetical protein